MNKERWQQVDSLLQAALGREPEERARFLDSACKGDDELRREVESLLASSERGESFLTVPALEEEPATIDEPTGMIGRQIGFYEILSPLGAGGMGEVYLAKDTRLGRKVALKILPSFFTRNERRLQRFQQEARTASALNHPNIITIFDIGETDSIHFIATEYIDGETLRTAMARRKFSLGEVLDIAIQIASALAAAHAAGIAHRDIKPENIMLRGDGILKVLDFGLAKLTEQHDAGAENVRTDPGTRMGTANYMSPEQARGREVDARSDIFSFGVVLYEMIARRKPFRGETVSHVLVSILEKDPPPLSEYAPETPAELQRIVSKALRKDREERYQAIREMLIDLKDLRQETALQQRLERSASPESKEATSDEETTVHVSYQTEEAATARPTLPGEIVPGRASGYEKSAAIEELGERKTLRDAKRRRKIIAGSAIACAAIIALITAAYYLWPEREEPQVKSLAVLPFKPLASDSRNEYLELGMAETLISRLSKLKQITVRPISAVSKYASLQQDAVEAGRELRTQYVLDGSIQRLDDSLRVTVRLLDTKDGRVIWSEQFDEKAANIFKVQDSISERVARDLAVRITESERQRLRKHSTESAEAYELYLKGRAYLNQVNPESGYKAHDSFSQAIALDPGYARAYAGLSDLFSTASDNFLAPGFALPKAKEYALKALEADESLDEAHLSMAEVKWWGDWDKQSAEAEYKRALELNPNYAATHLAYGRFLTQQSRFEEAIGQLRLAQELDPQSVRIRYETGWVYYCGRQYERAINLYREALSLDMNSVQTHRRIGLAFAQMGMLEESIAQTLKALAIREDPAFYSDLGWLYAKLGKRSEAQNALKKMQGMSKRRYISPYYVAKVYAGLGDRERVFEFLEQAYKAHSDRLLDLQTDPVFDEFRSDARFSNLTRRIGFAP
ncbi:MAG: protein kinase [Acidobacteriota bacterium]